MFMTIYSRALNVLMKKPLRLWGISLLSTLLIPVLCGLCGFAIPALGIAVSLLMSTSMTMVYLAGYRGKKVHTTQIFSCFKDWNTIKRVTLGMAWMTLWVFIWSLVPIVGPILAIIRTYEFRLTPYILITEPDVPLTEAFKESAKRTKGYKLQMWLADFVVDVLFAVASFILGLLAGIPYVRVVFGLVMFVFSVCYAALRPLFGGLVQAAFYEEISNPTPPAAPQPQQPQQPQQAPYQAPYQQAPYQQTPYQQTPYQQTPYQQPYQQAPYQQTPYQQPYQQPQQPQQAPYQAPYQQAPYQQPETQPQGTVPLGVCPNCGVAVEAGTKFCGKCGFRL